MNFEIIVFIVFFCFFPSAKAAAVKEEEDKIVGGTDVDIKDYPYQISLQSDGSHICGGSVLSKTHILTAAHCTDGSSARALSIRAGSSKRGSGGQVIQVKEIKQHPGYNPRTTNNDISILILKKDLTLSSTVKPIGLISAEVSSGKAVVSGWGTLSSGGSSPINLQAVNVTVITRKECREDYSQAEITDAMICTLDKGKDSCQGDSGGPLVLKGKQIGIVSWGAGCAKPKKPGVYTNVFKFTKFINDIIKEDKTSSPVYKSALFKWLSSLFKSLYN